jgi:phosphoribosyl 1,2-cyclic phosphodiesterase
MTLEQVTAHTVADTETQRYTRTCVLGGINLGSYAIAVESGVVFETKTHLRNTLESHFGLPVRYFFLTHNHSDHRREMQEFKDVTLVASEKSIRDMPRSIRLGK